MRKRLNEISNEIKGEILEIEGLMHFEAVTEVSITGTVILHVTSCTNVC
jgi:hypothetical protein